MEYRVKELREEAKSKGIQARQEDVANFVGVSKSSITMLEKGKTSLSFSNIAKIAEFFTIKLGRKVYIEELVKQDDMGGIETSLPVPENLQMVHPSDFVCLPELGHIPCGDKKPILENAQVVGTHWLPKGFVGTSKYILRAQGESMAPVIGSGDQLLIDPSHWNDGDIVVAMIDNEVTCKYLQHKGNHIILKPHNSNYETMVVNGDENAYIIGRVVKIVKDVVPKWSAR